MPPTDTLLNSINRRRAAIQHAADAFWPDSDETNRPIRKTFGIPLKRTMGSKIKTGTVNPSALLAWWSE